MDIASISAIVAAGGVIVGVVFAVLQLRDLVKARHTDLVVGLYQSFNTKEFQEADLNVLVAEFKDYNDFVKVYGPFAAGKPIHRQMRMVAAYFEIVGVLLYRKLIDPRMVDNLFSVRIRWPKLKPIIEGLRKHFNEPRLYEWFEYLHNEMQKFRQTLQRQQ